ncbi:MAG: tRNA (guanosine(46)-N7)-methyltransferase TrmB, partial [Peptostreptococcus porci]|nr:tRNA (guanosine(46)-N7)-methyltransferase TrmB [Peptostreptococcus porci]
MRRRKRKGSDEKLLSYENYVVNGKLNQAPPNINTLDYTNTQIFNHTNFDNREVVRDKTYDDIINNYRGQWSRVFGNNNPIHVEVGSGRGKFITTLALKNPDINY